ncbi:MAG: ArsC family reductase [Pseudomonas stutzeri]|uniref:ArsC family reductase n=1 Tax=Stutzerimonas stutzeri TaxID=316 RepID=UPI0016AA8534|nr:ArsC family reductase [Pseudomonas sp.]NIM30018.1 ArsC family reductase [Stutzerimonas stutzeri]NIM56865.1 ArsC family reductase [Stutzerimonas stutzeri]NIM85531.1 ArsC family reductase [Stutzerimonas stutzeri]NIN79232.1 ArsC family reductase [Stutzerimonas stutzeri]
MSEPDQRLCLYGIKACDTMKKARTWLDEHGQNYEFHDYKSAGIDRAHLEAWCNEHGWQTVLNRAGTTFRKLDDAAKADLDQARAIELMLAQPSMIKRPVLDLGDRTLIGFKPDLYAAALAAPK